MLAQLDQLVQNEPLAQLVQGANEWTTKRGQESGDIVSVKTRWASEFGGGLTGKALDRAYAVEKRSEGYGYTVILEDLKRLGFVEILSKKGSSTGRYFLAREITGRDISLAVDGLRENADPEVRAEKRPTFQEYDVGGVKGLKRSKSGSLVFTVYSPKATHIGPHAPRSERIGPVPAAKAYLERRCGQSHYVSVTLPTVGRVAASGAVLRDERFEKLADLVLSAGDGVSQGAALEQLIAYKNTHGSGWAIQ